MTSKLIGKSFRELVDKISTIRSEPLPMDPDSAIQTLLFDVVQATSCLSFYHDNNHLPPWTMEIQTRDTSVSSITITAPYYRDLLAIAWLECHTDSENV